MELDDFAWPARGDRLFVHDRNADSPDNWMSAPSLEVYAYAYEESARVLIAEVLEWRGIVSPYGLPAIFLARHAVELHLKALLVSARALAGEEADFEDIHSLVLLWEKVRPLLEKADYADHDESELYDAVGDLIKEYDAVDEGSMAFRYPVGKRSKDVGRREQALADEFEFVDMSVFARSVEGLHNFLSAAADKIEADRELQKEIQDYYGS